MYRQPTFGEVSASPAHRSILRAHLQREAGARAVDDWLVEEANLRGWFGATGLQVPDRPICPWLPSEALLAALLMPHGPMDVRLFKLVLRMLQSGQLEPLRVWLEAKKERADHTLYWLLERVPEEERNAAVEAVRAAHPAPPRGYRPLPISYDPSRLIKRPATKESLWRAARRSS